MFGQLKDSDLWFEDGNTVVIAQNVAFRVHRTLLSRHSDTFNDLFTIPQPTTLDSVGDCMDGCPIVRVADSAHDFKRLLHALYDGVNYLKHDESMEFSDLAALARLGNKYQLDNLVSGVCGRLASVFSTKVKNFNPATWGADPPLINVKASDTIEAFNLFRLLGRADMIPVAMYVCCQLPISTLVRGVIRADGTREQLSPGDLEACLVAREALTAGYAWLSLTFLEVSACGTCTIPGRCTLAISDVRQGPASGPDLCQGTDVLSGSLAFLAGSMHRDQLICDDCRDMLMSRHESIRKTLWEQLPTMMDLGNLDVESWPPYDD
ncbi:hypothetical protein BD309DRAFT_996973 [Dichomitus squalens]|nr:hypothetical protein BD309DRAFT_996973 [Dichomitus squalens]